MLLVAVPLFARAEAPQPSWQSVPEGELILRPFPSAPYPHASREKGYQGKSTTYSPEAHYSDSTVGIFIPAGYKPGESVDYVVHFHGHNNHVAKVIPQYKLMEQMAAFRVNAILIVPQGPRDAPDSGGGKLERDGNGFEKLMLEITDYLVAQKKLTTAKIGRVILSSHSGGYQVTAAILDHGGMAEHISDVILLDSSYGSLERFAKWAEASAAHRLVSLYTHHLAAANTELMGLLDRAGVKFQRGSDSEIGDDECAKRGTTFIATEVPHDLIPTRFFGRLVRTSESKVDGKAAMRVEKRPFGKMPDGAPVDLYSFRNGQGVEATVLSLGATLHTVSAPDRSGKSAVITLHLDTVAERLKDMWATGAVVGRFANRIAGAALTIDGIEYKLDANAGKHQIHGGAAGGYQHLLWKGEPIDTVDAVGVMLKLISPDGQGGYPGTMHVTVAYTLNRANELSIDYTATTDKPTCVNLTNHAYWNLAGTEGRVKDHLLQINADAYLAADQDLIPTGQLLPVTHTAMDFNVPRAIGSRADELGKKPYDHCYVLRKTAAGLLSVAAKVTEPMSGRVMEVLTTQPGVQFFTGNAQGFCLETQHYPDSPHQPAFPSTLLRPGEQFHERTVYRFSVVQK
jgi:aldose 1-epimerase